MMHKNPYNLNGQVSIPSGLSIQSLIESVSSFKFAASQLPLRSSQLLYTSASQGGKLTPWLLQGQVDGSCLQF